MTMMPFSDLAIVWVTAELLRGCTSRHPDVEAAEATRSRRREDQRSGVAPQERQQVLVGCVEWCAAKPCRSGMSAGSGAGLPSPPAWARGAHSTWSPKSCASSMGAALRLAWWRTLQLRPNARM